MTLVLGWLWTSAVIVQSEEEKEASLSERRPLPLRRSYSRPHVERVWIVRPVDSINDNNRPIENFTDPVRSFAVAIRDPETFLRYLRHEESKRLGKQTWTSHSQMLPSSKHVQMQILSQSDTKEKSPVLNIIVEQDDKMNMNSLMNLMDQVSSLSADNKERSKYNYEKVSISELEKQQKATWTQRYMQRNHEQNGNSVHKQRPTERNTSPERERDFKPNDSVEEMERSWKQQSLSKTDRKHRERHYRQGDGVVEPMLIIGEFGKRNPNYSRPITQFINTAQSHHISMAPSLHLLPPVFTTFRRIDLPQNLPSSTETPVTAVDENSVSRKRKKRPIAHNSRRPVDVGSRATDTSRSSIYTFFARNETGPLPANVSVVSTDIPSFSSDIPRQSMDNDVSHVHISIPRIYTSVSRAHTDVSAPPFTDISRVHIAISRQPLNRSYSSASSRLINTASVGSLSTPNVSELFPETTTVSYQSTETIQPGDSFRLNVNILAPSVDILPPLLTITENRTTDEPTGIPEESQDDEEIYVGNNPSYSSNQNEASSDSGAAAGQEYRPSSPHGASHPVARNIKTVQRDGADGSDTKQQSVSNHGDYEELRLTAAETAYYRRRQLRKQPVILEVTGE